MQYFSHIYQAGLYIHISEYTPNLLKKREDFNSNIIVK